MGVGLLDGVKHPPSFTYLDSVQGLCDNVTSRVVVDIFYAKAGQSDGTPLYVLVGAKITCVFTHFLGRVSQIIMRRPVGRITRLFCPSVSVRLSVPYLVVFALYCTCTAALLSLRCLCTLFTLPY